MRALCFVASLLLTVGLVAAPAAAADTSQVTLVFNSSVGGQLNDCGCKAKPLGGLARRAAFIDALETENVLHLDAGNLVSHPGKAEWANAAHDRFVAQQTAALGYDVIGVGANELSRGIPALRQLTADSGLEYVNANLFQDGKAVFEPYRIVEVGGVRFGITSVFEAKSTRDAPADLEVRDPALALRETLPKMREECDVVVLYSQVAANGGTISLLQSLGQSAGIDLVVEGATSGHYATLRKTGASYMLAANPSGKYIGQLDLTLQDGAIVDTNYELHELELKMPEAKDVANAVKSFEEGRKALAQSR